MAKRTLTEIGEQEAGQGMVWLIEHKTVGGWWVPNSAPYFTHANALRSLNRLRKRPAAQELRISLYLRNADRSTGLQPGHIEPAAAIKQLGAFRSAAKKAGLA